MLSLVKSGAVDLNKLNLEVVGMDKTPEALAKIADGHVRGKIVVKIE